MSRTRTIDSVTMNLRNQFHADNFTPMVENHPTRHGIMKMVSPRKKVQVWCDKVSHKGDLWVNDTLITEEMRKVIEEVATITDSPWLKGEKKIILKDDTHANRIKLFKKLCNMLGI